MKITLGFSPCPNDTFIFDAMVHGRVDTEGLEFDYFLADVEELNRRAFNSEGDITKISCHAYAYAAKNYRILDSGSALGFGNGPLVVSRKMIETYDLGMARIAIPGKYTTANLLFTIAWPEATNKTEYLFSDIVDILLKDEADAGLLIHETRFTYQRKGLVKVADLGEYWDKLTGLPIPLGFIVVNRRIPEGIAMKINRVLRRSVEYCLKNPQASADFVISNAKEIESDVLKNHIELFVNDFSIDLGETGKKAITSLFGLASLRGMTPPVPDDIFLT